MSNRTSTTPKMPIKSCGAPGGLQLAETTATPTAAPTVNTSPKQSIDEWLRLACDADVNAKHGDEK
jgi:hypothetical protein